MFLNDGIGDEDENDDDAVGDRESDWRATSLDVNSAGHQIKETGTDDSAGGWDRVQFEFLPTFQTAHCAGGWDRGKILPGVQYTLFKADVTVLWRNYHLYSIVCTYSPHLRKWCLVKCCANGTALQCN